VAQGIADEIGLKNVTTQHTRTEEIKDRKFDYVVSRAVAPLKDLWNWSRPILKAKGQGIAAEADDEKVFGGLLCLKGGDLTQEVHESGLHPRVWQIEEMFKEDFFKEKYLLFVPR
jgi:16S rRNA (guanine527-N7)-methyltransferase